MRPAHFHMMVTAEGYQPLVTQLYFSGDRHIEKDRWASAPRAKKRILHVQDTKGNLKKVLFDVNMTPKLSVEPASIGKLTGVYIDQKDQSKKLEFFKKDNSLWLKNDVFGIDLEYVDNNKFQPKDSTEEIITYTFEILASGSVKLNYAFRNGGTVQHSTALKL